MHFAPVSSSSSQVPNLLSPFALLPLPVSCLQSPVSSLQSLVVDDNFTSSETINGAVNARMKSHLRAKSRKRLGPISLRVPVGSSKSKCELNRSQSTPNRFDVAWPKRTAAMRICATIQVTMKAMLVQLPRHIYPVTNDEVIDYKEVTLWDLKEVPTPFSISFIDG